MISLYENWKARVGGGNRVLGRAKQIADLNGLAEHATLVRQIMIYRYFLMITMLEVLEYSAGPAKALVLPGVPRHRIERWPFAPRQIVLQRVNIRHQAFHELAMIRARQR